MLLVNVVCLVLPGWMGVASAAPPPLDPHAPQVSLEVRMLAGPSVLFAGLRKEATLQIPAAIPEMTLAEVSDQELSQNDGVRLVSATSLVETRPTVFAERLSENAVRALIGAVQADPHGQIVMAPKVTLFDGDSAIVADVVSRPFVVGMAEGEAHAAPPIGEVQEGTKFLVRCQVRPQQVVRVDFRARLTSINDVGYRTLAAEGGTVQVPRVHAEDVQLAAELPTNGTLALHLVGSSDIEKAVGEPMLVKVPYFNKLFKNTAPVRQELVILLTPRILPPEPAE